MTVKGYACLTVKYDPMIDVYKIDNIEYSSTTGYEIYVDWIDNIDINRFVTLTKDVDYTFTCGLPKPNEIFKIYNSMTITLTQNFKNTLLDTSKSYFKVYRVTHVTQDVKYMFASGNLQQDIEFSLDKVTKILQELVCKYQEILKLIPDIANLQEDVVKLKAANVKNIADILKLTNDLNSLLISLTTLTSSVANNIASINTLNSLSTDLRTELDALKILVPAPTSTGLTLVSYEDPNNHGKFLTRWETSNALPDPTAVTKGSLIVVKDPAAKSYELQTPSTFTKELLRNVLGIPAGSPVPVGDYQINVSSTGDVTFITKTPIEYLKNLLKGALSIDPANNIPAGRYEFNVDSAGALTVVKDRLPDAVGSTVASVPIVSDATTGSYALSTLPNFITALLRQIKGGNITTAIPEGQYIINVSNAEVISLITDPLPSGTFAEQGNSVVLTSAPKGYSLKKIIGLPDPSSAQSGQAVTLVDPQQGTYQYSDVIYGTTTGATKNSVLVIDDETFATTVFLSPANFIEGQLRTVLGTADADNVPAGDYVITIKADGTATYTLYTGGAEDIDQNTGIVSGLHLVSTGVDLSKIRIEPGVAQFVANVEGRPNAKTIFYELKTAIDLAVPTVPKEYFIYINSTGVASTKEVRMTSPRGNELCLGSVRVDVDNGIVRISQDRRKVDNVQAQIYEIYQYAGQPNSITGSNLVLSTTSPTNQLKLTGGTFARAGGYPVSNKFFETAFSDRNPMPFRFLTGTNYSGVFTEFPKSPPTYINSVAGDLPVGRWGYYLFFIDVRHDPEVKQVADPTKIDTGCSITVIPAYQTYGTKPNGITSTLFATYYNANSGKIPQELTRYGKVFGILIYKGNSDLNDPDNILSNASLTSGANTSTGTNLPSGTTADVGKVLTLLNAPDTYGFVDVISNLNIPAPTVADAGKVLYVDQQGNYALFKSLSDLSVPTLVVTEGLGIVTTRSPTTDDSNLASGQDLFNKNTSIGRFLKVSMLNNVIDGSQIGFDHFSTDFSGAGKMVVDAHDINYEHFILPANPTANVWFNSEGLSIRNQQYSYTGGYFDPTYGFSTINHSASPIIIKPNFALNPPFPTALYSTFAIRFSPLVKKGEKVTVKIVIKKLPNYPNLILPADTDVLDRHDIQGKLIAKQNNQTKTIITNIIIHFTSGRLVGAKTIADTSNGQSDHIELPEMTGITKQNVFEKLAVFMSNYPDFFTYTTDAIDPYMDINFTFNTNITAKNNLTRVYKPVAHTSTDLAVDYEISSDASFPKDHITFELGTLKTWLADTTFVTNGNLTITVGKKLVATLTQLKAYTGTDVGYIFDPSKYGANTLPTLNLETDDKSDIVRFVPRALSNNDIVYISERTITQDMIDSYIIRVRINSLDTSPLIVNTKDNIKLSFVDADKF